MSREGTYVASVSNWDFGMNRAGTAPQFILEFDIIGVPGAGGKPAPLPVGQMPWSGSIYMSFSDASKDWTFRRLKALGFDSDDLDTLNPGDANAHDFTGKTFKVEAAEREVPSRNDPSVMYKSLDYNISLPKAAAAIEPRDRESIAKLKEDMAAFRARTATKPKPSGTVTSVGAGYPDTEHVTEDATADIPY